MNDKIIASNSYDSAKLYAERVGLDNFVWRIPNEELGDWPDVIRLDELMDPNYSKHKILEAINSTGALIGIPVADDQHETIQKGAIWFGGDLAEYLEICTKVGNCCVFVHTAFHLEQMFFTDVLGDDEDDPPRIDLRQFSPKLAEFTKYIGIDGCWSLSCRLKDGSNLFLQISPDWTIQFVKALEEAQQIYKAKFLLEGEEARQEAVAQERILFHNLAALIDDPKFRSIKILRTALIYCYEKIPELVLIDSEKVKAFVTDMRDRIAVQNN